MRVRTILVVDDEPDVRGALVRRFERHGFVALGAAGAAEALQLAAAIRFDAVLLGHTLPGADGREALRRLRADPRQGGVRVVVYAAADDPRVHAAARAAGADDVLVGPVRFAGLLAAVRALVPAS